MPLGRRRRPRSHTLRRDATPACVLVEYSSPVRLEARDARARETAAGRQLSECNAGHSATAAPIPPRCRRQLLMFSDNTPPSVRRQQRAEITSCHIFGRHCARSDDKMLLGDISKSVFARRAGVTSPSRTYRKSQPIQKEIGLSPLIVDALTRSRLHDVAALDGSTLRLLTGVRGEQPFRRAYDFTPRSAPRQWPRSARKIFVPPQRTPHAHRRPHDRWPHRADFLSRALAVA